MFAKLIFSLAAQFTRFHPTFGLKSTQTPTKLSRKVWTLGLEGSNVETVWKVLSKQAPAVASR